MARIISHASSDAVNVSACERQRVKLTCRGKDRIQIVNAFYGRLDADTCSSLNSNPIHQRFLKNTTCESKTATSTFSKRCDGKKKCVVGVNNRVFGDPCVGTFKYSDVQYRCRGKMTK